MIVNHRGSPEEKEVLKQRWKEEKGTLDKFNPRLTGDGIEAGQLASRGVELPQVLTQACAMGAVKPPLVVLPREKA